MLFRSLFFTNIGSSSPKREGVGGTINRVSKLCEGVAVWDGVEHELKGYLRLVQIAKALGQMLNVISDGLPSCH